MPDRHRFETLCLHGGHRVDGDSLSRAVPIHQTTSYLFRDTRHAADLFDLKEEGNIYTRIGNPTTDVLEKRLALLEGGTGALALASGQAATAAAVLTLAGAGDEVVASSKLYGGTATLLGSTLARLGIATTFLPEITPDGLRAAVTDRTRAVLVETIANPGGDVPDLAALADAAHGRGVPLLVDNTAATPFLCRPMEHGADVVIHSATKFLGGHGTSLGGILVDSGRFPWNNGRFPAFTEPCEGYHGLRYWDAFGDGSPGGNTAFIRKARLEILRDLGAALSPFNAFLLLQGVETLPLRMERHCANALTLARWLLEHPKVAWVSYPGLEDHPSHGLAKKYLSGGFGGILTFGVRGGLEAGRRVADGVKLASLLANIGDARTLIIHPATTTHGQLTPEQQRAAGVTPDLLRLSVGLEHPHDIREDLNRALESA